MTSPVSLPLAKLLKDKGFDIPTIKCYAEERFIDKNTGGDLFTGVFRLCAKSRFHKKYYLAPTITEVVMWLYEKHEIWIEVSKIDGYQNLFFYTITGSNGFNFGHKITVIEWDDEKCDKTGYNNKYHNSPTEAYQAAIEYTLNNLI